MKRACILLALSVPAAVRADPYAGFYYPAGIEAGMTNRIVVGGQRFGGIKGGWVSGEGVKVVSVEKVKGFPVVNGKGQAQWLDKWTYAILKGQTERPPFDMKDERDLLSWTRHPWWEHMNELPPLEFSMVARYLNTPRNPLQMSPSLSERLIITVAAAADAVPGVRDIVLYDDRGSTAPHPFFGRPSRDTGELKERNNAITAKQRLYLYNSGKLTASLGRMVGEPDFRKLTRPEKIEDLYLRFLSRRPTKEELQLVNRKYNVNARDIAWLLMNSREFLYRI